MDKEDFDLEIEEEIGSVYEEDEGSVYEEDEIDDEDEDEDEDEDIDEEEIDGDIDTNDEDILTNLGSDDEEEPQKNSTFVKNLPKNSTNTKPKNIKFTNPPLVRKKTIIEKSNKPKTVYIVPESERITSDLLVKSERAQLEGILSKHIDKNGCPEYLYDIVIELKKKNLHVLSDDIAKEIVRQRRCPLLLRRPIGENSRDELVVEEWDPNIMKIHL
jgi:hypothetical protein